MQKCTHTKTCNSKTTKGEPIYIIALEKAIFQRFKLVWNFLAVVKMLELSHIKASTVIICTDLWQMFKLKLGSVFISKCSLFL